MEENTESLWSRLPNDIIHIILKYTGKVIYRDGKYIDIYPLKLEKYNIIYDLCIQHKNNIKELYFGKTQNEWYVEFNFQERAGVYTHGLAFSFNFDYKDTYEICYVVDRMPLEDEGGTAWVQIRTIMM